MLRSLHNARSSNCYELCPEIINENIGDLFVAVRWGLSLKWMDLMEIDLNGFTFRYPFIETS